MECRGFGFEFRRSDAISLQEKVSRIGFMQGRLSPQLDGKIQAFPWANWQGEFSTASATGFSLMEWTLDQDRLYENPLMTEAGRREIRTLKEQFGLAILSLTGDCFMQAPFWKRATERDTLLSDLRAIIRAAAATGIRLILIPLVDAGRLEDGSQEDDLRAGLASVERDLADSGTKITFESDCAPEKLATFIEGFDPRYFGLTFDIGNSASLGYDFKDEIAAYGARITNVHVKDRLLGGTTVPLGSGNAKLPETIAALERAGYRGNYILQTARAPQGDHAGVLRRYKNMVEGWLEQAA
jgi:L-ribulose-5-phosphate 3-epimerase